MPALLFQSMTVVAVYVVSKVLPKRKDHQYQVEIQNNTSADILGLFGSLCCDLSAFIGNVKSVGPREMMTAPSPRSALLTEVIFCFYLLLFSVCTVSPNQ